MYKKIALFVLAVVIMASSYITIFNKLAFADFESGSSYFPDSIVQSVAKKSVADVYVSCFKQNTTDGKVPTTYSTINPDPKATHSEPPEPLGVIDGVVGIGISDFSKDNNSLNCKNLTMPTFVSSMNGLGFSGSDPRHIICSMNAVADHTKENNCNGKAPDNPLVVDTKKFESAIYSKLGGVFTEAEKYYMGYQLLHKYCDVKDRGTDERAIGETNYPVYVFNKDGSGGSRRYTSGKAHDKISLWNEKDTGKEVTISCADLMNGNIGWYANTWVKAYSEYLKALAAAEKKSKSKPTTSTPTTPASGTKEYTEACKALGYSSGKELEACAEGFSHLGDESFCTTKYQGSPGELAACQAAQGSTKEAPPPEEKEEDQENCKIDYIGWFICPIVNTLASMSEGARAQLINMLTVDAKSILGDTSDGSVYSYWSKIRDYANILFVVFFLFVIYSQMTGYGLDNYGIKRMLPKLIIGVIVVNASFYICGLLVDLSNVVGSSAFNFVSTAAVGDIPAGDWSNSDSGWINKIAAGALILTVGYFALAAVISMLLFVVITAVTTIFLLGVREAIIIMCIVLSPLAFVAMIMPNTEGLYKKWWSAFKAALMVYPMVGLVYGASNLAARILGSGLKESDIIMQSIVALLVFAPLLIVPKLVRSAVEIIGIGGAVAWLNKKMNKGRDRLTDKVGKWRENKLTSQFGKHRREKAQLRNAQIRGGTYRGKGGIANFRNWRSAANRRLNAKSGDFGQKRKLVGSMALLEEDKERMKMANAWIADNNMSSDRLAEIATGFRRDKDNNIVPVDLSGISSYQRRAAMQALAPHMTGQQAADAIGQSGAKKAPWVGGKQLEAIRQGTYNEQAAMSDYIENKVSGEGLANAGAEEIRKMRTFAQGAQNNGNNSYMESLSRARADLEADAKRAGGLQTAVRREINDIPLPQNHGSGGGNQGGNGGNQGNRNNQGGGGGGNQGGDPRSGGGGGRKQGGDPRSGGGGNDQNDQGDRDQGGNDQGGNDSNQGDGN